MSALLWCVLAPPAAFALPPSPAAVMAANGDSGKHMGVATCASTLCHGSVRPLSARGVQQNEYLTWSNFDPHARTYKVLFEERSLKMAQRLGYKNAHQAPECLACHTDSVSAAKRGPRFQVSDGIGCEACHGGSENWVATHDDAPQVTHAVNLATGLRALERPDVRAEVCLDCHLGSPKRFASHQMMAAGHPRLAFELDTYTELWRTSGGREHYKVDGDYPSRKGRYEPVIVWLTGLTAASRRTVDMIAWHVGGPTGGIPDFALYNCYSCHRTMQVSAGPKGNYDGLPPGTLRLQDGHVRALLAVLDATDTQTAAVLRQELSSLHSSVGSDRSSLLRTTDSMGRSLWNIEARLPRTTWSKRALAGVFEAMTQAAKKGAFADYAAAEQAAMAMVLLLAELDATDARARQVDELFGALEDDSRFDGSRFERALNLLRTGGRAN